MAAMQVFHMNKGDGQTSYARNSTVQSKIISVAKPVMDETLLEMLSTGLHESIGIADLGCSSGPNSLLVISEIIDTVYAQCQKLNRSTPELRVFLSDLPYNDFNYSFGLLPAFFNNLKREKAAGFGHCFISATPGSFYGRLFSSRSLHFVHSSSSLHWLSQLPPGLAGGTTPTLMNKGKVYISKSSPRSVLEAYSSQFQNDFSLFLRSRSEEMVPGGCMVLSFMGRRSDDPTTDESCYHWELLSQALMSMASEGIVKEEKIDSFNAPYYAPCPEELKSEIQKEGSFIINRLEAFEIDWDGGADDNAYDTTAFAAGSPVSRGEKVAKTVRAVVESMLESQFGRDIMDELFKRYAAMVNDYLSKNRTKYINLVISIVRKDY